MTRRIIDLSVSLLAAINSDPPVFAQQITYVDHRVGATQLAASFSRETR